MRHRKGYRKLSKPTDQRMALLKSLALALIKNGSIMTSGPRAKETRKVIEKIIALSKKGGTVSLKRCLQIIPEKGVIKEFFKSAPERFKSNPGGCTRISATGLRRGDSAQMVRLELL